MKKFDYSLYQKWHWSSEVHDLCSAIHEAKTRQNFYLKQKPKQLEKLVEIAKVQSVGSSNAIEGIITSDSRLKKICSDKTAPRNRDENEIEGYRDALDFIHSNYMNVSLLPNNILYIHKIMLKKSKEHYAGKYKSQNNLIVEIDTDGNRSIRFQPLDAVLTPEAINNICLNYIEARDQGLVDPLILIPIFVQDFLCIHPFMDGNGRVSRLLTLLLLYQSGYEVGKYISIEKLIYDSKNRYYEVLNEAQQGWHENKNNPEAFVKYMLSVIISAYRDLDERFEIVSSGKSLDVVRKAIQNIFGDFTKEEIHSICPSLSYSSIEHSLKDLVDAGELNKLGVGKSTKYHKK